MACRAEDKYPINFTDPFVSTINPAHRIPENRKRSKKLLTRQGYKCYATESLIQETDEAEITAMMPLQRVRGAESRMRNKLSNGPLRAQSNEAAASEYSATPEAGVNCRGYDSIPLSVRGTVNQGGTADSERLFVLGRVGLCQGLFFAASNEPGGQACMALAVASMKGVKL